MSCFNQTANVNNAADATFTVIPAESGRQWEVATIIVSSPDAGTFTLNSGSTALIGPIYIAANTTIVIEPSSRILLNASNEALTLTKGTSGHDYTVFAQYRAN
jgi:hypothetical protein